jgi:hypothetical protein
VLLAADVSKTILMLRSALPGKQMHVTSLYISFAASWSQQLNVNATATRFLFGVKCPERILWTRVRIVIGR